MGESGISLSGISSAYTRIKDKVHYTPLFRSAQLGGRSGTELYFKCENLQKTGSFKVRGVLNKIGKLTEEQRSRGLVTVSAGNHAQAVAWAAAAMGVACTAVMPETASRTKIRATEAYGAKVILPGDVYAAFEKTLHLEKDEGLTFVHPFEDRHLIEGHGTVGLEIMEQLEHVDAVVCGVGSGALSSGIAVAMKEQNPKIRLYGVEPLGANAMQQSFEAGEAVTLDQVNTIADGLAPPMAGGLPFSILRKYMEEVVTVTDREIEHAVKELLSWTKLLVEPSGAAATAAILTNKLTFEKGERVVSVLSGGNMDLDLLSKFIQNS
ncbi:MAG: threonine/serine dehydratase [Bacteroidota bacterium]